MLSKKEQRRKQEEEKLNEAIKETSDELRTKKFSWLHFISNIVLFPFRLVEFILKFFYSILNFLLIVLAVACLVGVVIYAKVYPMYQQASATAYDKLSKLEDSNFRMLQNTVIYDKDDKVIGEINAGDYKYAKIKDVSDYVQKGYIATEDKRFMEHIGIDAQSLIRAGISLFRHNGEITQGGSTITQQVIKNNLLSQEQSYSRKLVEILIAPKIEQEYSKAKIMEFYVNTNYYGNGCYGIETASRFYFNKSSKNLTLAEAAMLCGVSNSPNKYNPIASMKFATEKKVQVLGNMLGEGYITKKDYEKALKQKIKVKATVDEYDNDNYMISYALYCAALDLMEKDGFKFKYLFENTKEEATYMDKYQSAYSEKASLLRAGGFKIHTSFDIKLQKKLQRSIDKSLAGYTEKQKNKKYALQSSAVCIDNQTGYVVALVGGRGEKDEFNRAFLAKRQPGSSIKPLLVYAPSINEGVVNPSTIYTDKKVYAISSNPNSYSPSNSGGGYRGDMPIREALARSINTIAFQLYKNTTPEISMKYLSDMRFSTMTYSDTTALSLCLGGFTNGIRVVDLAKGYATLPMGGKYTTRTCIRYLEHEVDGLLIDKRNLVDTQSEVFTEDTAFMMCDMMQGTLAEGYGTAHNIYNSKMVAGGKTGTTSSNKDAWFSGFSKYYTCSVWVGYDTPRVMAGMYGGTVPAKIWSKFMTGIKKNMTKADFDKPSTIALRKVSGSDYIGKNISIKKGQGKIWYNTRRGGTEWYSKLNDYAISLKRKEREIQVAYNLARKKANAFLSSRISSIEDALSLDSRYAEVMSYIDKINDSYKSKRLRKQVSKYYDALAKVVAEDWQTYIKEYKASIKRQAEAEQKRNIQNSREYAATALKANRIQKAEWYINEINNREYNTDITKLLISDAEEAVRRLKGYPEYKSYLSRLNKAKSYANSLPSKIVMPVIPQDSDDSSDINEDKYYDKEVDDLHDAEEELDEYNKNHKDDKDKPNKDKDKPNKDKPNKDNSNS